MSKRKSGRNINGILLLDKRSGVSSNQALQEVRRLFNANKAGHAGTLDPLATGLLPLCFGEATKVSSFMSEDRKLYQTVIQLGMITDTGDAEGAIISVKPVPEFSEGDLKTCLLNFTGEIEQIPPMFSALKHNGKKLYELARKGEVVARKARRINIFELHLMNYSEDLLTLNVLCSKGTYIRTFAEDIGNFLGCGGTVTELRRLAVGRFCIENAKTLEQLITMDERSLMTRLIDIDNPLDFLPALELKREQAMQIMNGQKISAGYAAPGPVRIYHNLVFLGLGEILLDGKLAPKKMFNTNIETLSKSNNNHDF